MRIRERVQSIYVGQNIIAWLFISIAVLLALLISYSNDFMFNSSQCIIISTLTIIITSVYCIKNFAERDILLGFNITFFLFLLSGMFTCLFNEELIVKYLSSSDEAALHTNHCIAISIIVIDTTAYILLNSKRGKRIEEKAYVSEKGKEQIIFILFLIIMICKFATSVIRYYSTSRLGYSTVYQYNVNMPIYLRLPASVFYLCFCVWLSAHPQKTKFAVISFIIILLEGLVFFSGDRGESMSLLLVLAFYFIKRCKKDKDFFRFKKRYFLYIALIVPIIVYLMQYVSFSRKHMEMVSETVYKDFFSAQGISAQVISKGYDLRDSIASIGGYTYASGSLRSYLLHNGLARKLFGTSMAVANTEEVALSGESFGSTMAYLRFRTSYLNGIGCGTSYVAELWHDGGLVLLVFGSIFLGLLIWMVIQMTGGFRGILSNAIFLLMSIYIIQIPRGNCFAWLTGTFSVNNLMVMLLIALMVYRKNK